MKYKKIKKGDKVKMLSGKDRNKQGKVLRIFRDAGKLTVEGLNIKIKHARAKKSGETGQKIEIPGMVDISKVGIVCPKCHKITRIGFKIADAAQKGQRKIRICKKCNQAID